MNISIKQNNQITEYVSSELIDILYKLTKSNILGGGSNEDVTQLQGRVRANIAYDDAITFLNENFGPDFNVSADASYVRIEDPAVFEVLMQRLQNDGVGLQMSAFNNKGCPKEWFLNNTNIRTFCEIKYFTNEVWLEGCTNLTTIDLDRTNTTVLRDLPNLTRFNGPDSPIGYAKIKGLLSPLCLNIPNLTTVEIDDEMGLNTLGNVNTFRSIENIDTIIMTPVAGLAIGWYAFSEKRHKIQVKIKNLKNYIQCNFEHAGFFNGNSASELLLNDERVISVVIPNDVNIVGNGIFENYKYLTSITLHSGITAFKMYAFRNATNAVIADIDCPYLTELGEEAFKGTKLQRITNLGQILEIKKNTFADCTSLTDITFPGTINSVGENAFNNTAWLNGKNNTVIYVDNVLYKCKGTIDSTLVIPNNVLQIVSHAFDDITSLESITIGPNVTSIGIGDGLFKGCTNLTTIVVNSNNAKYDSRSNCNAIIETVTNKIVAACYSTTIPNTVTTVGSNAFRGVTLPTTYTIPSSITTIESRAFSEVLGVVEITIPNSVTTIGENAFHSSKTSLKKVKIEALISKLPSNIFYDCYVLETVELPSTITSLGTNCFTFNFVLRTIILNSTNPPSVNNLGNGISPSNITIYVPVGSEVAYQNHEVWGQCTVLNHTQIPT